MASEGKLCLEAVGTGFRLFEQEFVGGWTLLEAVGSCWTLLESIGRCCKLLEGVATCWKVFKAVSSRKLLETDGCWA